MLTFAARRHFLPLAQLALDHNQIGDTGATGLAMALAANRTLVNVCRACLFEVGMIGAWVPLRSVQLLLSGNNICSAGVAGLARTLDANCTLKQVFDMPFEQGT